MDKKYGLIDLKAQKVAFNINKVIESTKSKQLSFPDEEKDDISYSKERYEWKKKRNLETDQSIYLYDEIYDDIKKNQREEESITKAKKSHKPKYIEAIMNSSKLRQIENERRMESLIHKEREKEGSTYDDKETFVTNTYKTKIEESLIRQEIDKKIDAIEDKEGSNVNITKFYHNIYKQTFEDTAFLNQSEKSSLNLREQQEKLVKEYMDRKVDSNITTPNSVLTKKDASTSRTVGVDNNDEKRFGPKHQERRRRNPEGETRTKPRERGQRPKKSRERSLARREERTPTERKENYSRTEGKTLLRNKGNSNDESRYSRSTEEGNSKGGRERLHREEDRSHSSHGSKRDRRRHDRTQGITDVPRKARDGGAQAESDDEEEKERKREKELITERLKIFIRRNTKEGDVEAARMRYIGRLEINDKRGGLDTGFEPSDLSWKMSYETLLRLFEKENM